MLFGAADTCAVVYQQPAVPLTPVVTICLLLQGSDVSERLVDAELAAGDLAAARNTMREAVDARTILYGR